MTSLVAFLVVAPGAIARLVTTPVLLAVATAIVFASTFRALLVPVPAARSRSASAARRSCSAAGRGRGRPGGSAPVITACWLPRCSPTSISSAPRIADLDTSLAASVEPFRPVLKRLRTIPGVFDRTAVMLLAERGADMSVFPTAAYLASWAGICPGNNTSGAWSHSGRTRHGSVALRTALTEAAHAAARAKGTYLAAHHASEAAGGCSRQSARPGTTCSSPTGTSRTTTSTTPTWAPTGRSDDTSSQHRVRKLVHQLEQLGHTVTLGPAA